MKSIWCPLLTSGVSLEGVQRVGKGVEKGVKMVGK